MSNLDKAAQMIRDLSEVDGETLGYAHVHNIAQDLADAGLLAPELPEFRSDYSSVEVPARSTLIGHDDDCVRYSRDTVLVGTWHGEVEFSLGKYGEVSVYMSTEQARDLAYALLAAANYAEGHP